MNAGIVLILGFSVGFPVTAANRKPTPATAKPKWIKTQSGLKFRVHELSEWFDASSEQKVSVIRLIPDFEFTSDRDWSGVFRDLWPSLKKDPELTKNAVVLVRITDREFLHGSPARTVTTGYRRDSNGVWNTLPPDEDPTPHLIQRPSGNSAAKP